MRRGIRLGSVFGIDILIDPSWFFISFLIAWSLGQVFRDLLPNIARGGHLVMGILGALLFFSSVLGHELSHALVAKRKRLPVDSITLFVFGGVARIRKEPSSAGDEFKVAIAGPLSSVVFGAIFFVIGIASETLGVLTAAALFQVLGYINFVLAAFNMLPGFPLDGGRVLRSIVWRVSGDMLKATKVASIAGRLVAGLLVAVGVYRIAFQDQLFGGIWLILIALFLNQAAGSSYQQLVFRKSLEGLLVGDLMTEDPKTIAGNVTVETAVDDYFLADRHTAFPVVGFSEQVEGLLTLQMVRETPRELWATTMVRQVMLALNPAITAAPEDSLASVIDRIESNPAGRFLVLDGDKLTGILTSSDIARRVHFQSALGENR